jgi:TonB family protein
MSDFHPTPLAAFFALTLSLGVNPALAFSEDCTPACLTEAVSVDIPPPDVAVATLLDQLRDGSSADRAAAALALTGAPESEELVGALERAARDGDKAIRDAAVWALEHHRPSPPESFDRAATPLNDVKPKYPPEAFVRAVQGNVTVEVLIDESGNVVHAAVRRSIPMIDESALETARRSVFAPAIRKGRAVPQLQEMTVPFRFF